MATTMGTHNVALTEGAAIDGETSAEAVRARTPYLPYSLAFAHVEIVSLNCEVALLRKHLNERDDALTHKIDQLISADVYLRIAQGDCETLIEVRVAHEARIKELEGAIYKRDAELVEKRTALIYASNQFLDAKARVESLQMCVTTLDGKVARLTDYLRESQEANSNLFDMRVELEGRIADKDDALRVIMAEAETVSRDADAQGRNVMALNEMLEISGKREDEQYELLQGIRAMAASDHLTDGEKVSMILRLTK